MMFVGVIIGYVIVTIITAVSLVVLYFKWSYQYWERRKVPTVQPRFPYGNIRSISNREEPEYAVIHRIYQELKAKGYKHGGIYSVTRPVYIPTDAEYVKNIMITDFQYFYNRAIYYNEKDDPVSAHLLALEGQRWKNMRMKLTPAFTSGKMKTMFYTMLKCSDQLTEALEEIYKKKEPVNIRDTVSCYTTDIIGSCAFGVDCNSFKEPDPEFLRFGRKSFHISTARNFTRLLTTSFPNFSKFLGLHSLPADVGDFFIRMARETTGYRKEKKVRTNDLLQILMELGHSQNLPELNLNEEVNGTNGKDQLEYLRRPLSLGEIAANCFLFFIAGFETSSTTMSFCLYEVSQNQEIQDKMRREINAVLAKHDGRITYETLFDMKYMKQVFEETLRKYPIIPVMKRMCTDDYKIPGTDVVLERGVSTYISAYSIHHDPDNFHDPEKFDPDRFNEENKGNIKAGSYLGFGEGPRICIGKRFGIMQMTIGMMKLLKNYKVKLNSRTKVPIEFDPKSFLMVPREGIWVELEKL